MLNFYKNLKKGDKVIIRFYTNKREVGTVEKVLKNNRLRVNGYTFTDGCQSIDNFHFNYLNEWSQEAEDKINKKKEMTEKFYLIKDKLDKKSVTYEQLDKIYSILFEKE